MIYLLRCWVILRDDNRTSSAASLSTAQFRSCEPDAPKVFEKGYFGIDIIEDHACAIEVEAERIVIGGCD
jgi:hypothetical protein